MKIKKNGKVITLSESDLRRIAKRYLNEQQESNPMAECCEEAGIKVPPSCAQGDYTKCLKDVGQMVISDPMGSGTKAIAALNCLKDKSTSGSKTPVQY